MSFNFQKNTELVVLQSTSFCNIDCKYCYLIDRNKNIIISPELLDTTLRKVLSSTLLANNVKFLWHCGEPLVVGIHFYKKVIEITNKYNVHNINITHGIQTNATLISQDWCNFIKNHNFHIGVSIDGPDFLHDNNRVTRDGSGTHARVMRGVDLLKKNNINLSAIGVVTDKTLDYPHEFFEFYVNEGFTSLSLLIEEVIGENTSTSFQHKNTENSKFSNLRYINFMTTLLELWLKNKEIITIREFIEISSNIMKTRDNCSFEPKYLETEPLKIITIQSNGDISTFYPELAAGTKSDRRAFIIGNITMLDQLEDIIKDKNFLSISASIKNGINNCKITCNYFNFCGGRSPGIKMYENNSFESTATQHCLLQRQLLTDVIINRFQH